MIIWRTSDECGGDDARLFLTSFVFLLCEIMHVVDGRMSGCVDVTDRGGHSHESRCCSGFMEMTAEFLKVATSCSSKITHLLLSHRTTIYVPFIPLTCRLYCVPTSQYGGRIYAAAAKMESFIIRRESLDNYYFWRSGA